MSWVSVSPHQMLGPPVFEPFWSATMWDYNDIYHFNEESENYISAVFEIRIPFSP